MKIAIPLFGTRIAPRFDCTDKFLLVAVENGNIIARQELLAEGWPFLARIKKLRELDVDTLICNGIDCFSSRKLHFNGIRIYSWVTGEVEEALRCFLDGRLEAGCERWRSKEERFHRVSNQMGQGRRRGSGHEEPVRKYNHYKRRR
jgi:predicted Fe-Mo cluster-binding NifX family protein